MIPLVEVYNTLLGVGRVNHGMREREREGGGGASRRGKVEVLCHVAPAAFAEIRKGWG